MRSSPRSTKARRKPWSAPPCSVRTMPRIFWCACLPWRRTWPSRARDRNFSAWSRACPDGFVVTGLDGRILTANAAFLDLAEFASEEQARGESLERWLGASWCRSRRAGSLTCVSTARCVVRHDLARGIWRGSGEVEVSAVSVPGESSLATASPFASRAVRRLPRAAGPRAAALGRATDGAGGAACR